MTQPFAMRSPDGHWHVAEIASRAGRSFLVRERQVVGSTVSTIGRMLRTLDQVAELLGDDFDLLVNDSRHPGP